MDNPGIPDDIWSSLHQKWSSLLADGHHVEVNYLLVQDPRDSDKTIAIDIAQNIDNEWYVQTVQTKLGEGCKAVGLAGATLDRLIHVANELADSLTEPLIGRRTYDDEMHLFMQRTSPMTSEIHGHVISKKGEKINVRTKYKHYYVINEILEQTSKIMNEEYIEIQLFRNKDDNGRLYFQFVPA